MASRAEEGVETVLRRGRRGSVGVQDGGGFLGARFLLDPVDWRKGVGGGRAHTFIIIVVTIIIVIIIIRRTVPVGNVFHPAELSTNSLGDFVVFWNSDFQTVFHTAELSTNSLGDFVVFWNSDFQAVFHTTELFTNSPGDFVVFWNYD